MFDANEQGRCHFCLARLPDEAQLRGCEGDLSCNHLHITGPFFHYDGRNYCDNDRCHKLFLIAEMLFNDTGQARNQRRMN